MAALSDADLRAILGKDYEATLRSMNEEESEEGRERAARRQREVRLQVYESSRLSAVFLLVGGVIFIWADWMLNGFTLNIQLGLGIISSLAAVFWLGYLRGTIRKLNHDGVAEPILASRPL